jgi:hypothetical protein
MKAKRLVWQALAVLASLCLTMTVLAAPARTQNSEAVKPETGYVISLRGNTLTLSNVPMGNRRGGGDAGPRIMVRTADGGTRELKGEEAEQAMKRMRSEGGGTSINVNEENGKRTYTVTGPDGKSRKLTQEEYEKLRKKMESEGGGRMMMHAPNGSPPSPASSGQSAGATMTTTVNEEEGGQKGVKKKVQFSRFAVTDQTSKPDGLARGTKVKVHYRLEGEKKIATRVELLTE